VKFNLGSRVTVGSRSGTVVGFHNEDYIVQFAMPITCEVVAADLTSLSPLDDFLQSARDRWSFVPTVDQRSVIKAVLEMPNRSGRSTVLLLLLAFDSQHSNKALHTALLSFFHNPAKFSTE